MAIVDELEQLQLLFKNGFLTDEEFHRAKQLLLYPPTQCPEMKDVLTPASTANDGRRPHLTHLLGSGMGVDQTVDRRTLDAEPSHPPTVGRLALDPRPQLPGVHDIKKNTPLGLTALILGLVSIVLYHIGIIPILAIIFGAVGTYQFNESKEKNKWMAIVGMILGIVYTLVLLGGQR